MATTRLYMSMSLDGFIAGPNETDDHGLGDGGLRLHDWILEGPTSDADRQVVDEMMACRAIVAGRGTFEPAEGWGGDHHDGIPIWVLSRRPRPDWTKDWPLVTYGNDVEAAFAAAREAAGDGVVLVHGAAVAVRALQAGVLDELEIHLVSALMGEGRPLFAGLGLGPHELDRVRVVEGDGVTHLRYRVRR
ncbi:dihydrofolate reductase family protein [Nocardioides islandensis]|uniref:Dihydrofolate reductase family protein n=1 Tax=Nocardioides islandensis TaxID=433663 RepID=A0A930VHN4_9ACTN|nr:dihydrofolate reductase family protein [Nocardioides islandensis]MBF4765053.1 dihydrofolate reductase family protein [Nocardioides islandensis]